MPACAVGLDVGGTKIAAGVVQADGKVLESVSVPTPADGDVSSTVAPMLQCIDRFTDRYPEISAVGVGAAGMVDWPSGHIRWAPNNSYRNIQLRDVLASERGIHTVVDNDANVAAWAEMRAGAGVGYDNLVVLTVGTGIGAGLVLDGKIYRGATGIGGEAGHIIVNPNGGATCGCGSRGCLEAMASGTALARIARRAVSEDGAGRLAQMAAAAGRISGELVHEAACSGDVTAQSLFREIGYWLGIGIASLVTLLDVQIVIIGGGLSSTDELLLRPARASFREFVFSASHRHLPPVVRTNLGPEAGIVGAALLALDSAGD